MWYVSDGRSNHPPHLDGYSRQSNEVTEVGERSQRWEGSPPKEADHELYLSSLGVQLEEQACSWSGQMKVSTVISTVSVGRLLTGVHSWVTAAVTTDRAAGQRLQGQQRYLTNDWPQCDSHVSQKCTTSALPASLCCFAVSKKAVLFCQFIHRTWFL